MIKRIIQLALFTIVLNSNATVTPTKYSTIIIRNVPHLYQKKDFCAEACAAMYLQKLGENMDQDYIFDRSLVPATEARGLYASELAYALSEIGFDIGNIWTPHYSDFDLEREFSKLHDDLINQIPSIVLMHTSKTNPDEHFRLILGYDDVGDNVIYHEPANPKGAYQKMSRTTFLELWAIQDGYQWGTIRIRLDAEDIEYGNVAEDITEADYAQHLMGLDAGIPPNFTISIEKPFVIVSDCAQEKINDYSIRIIRQVVKLIKQDFFLKDPNKIIDIWLLKDKDSYNYYSKEIFNINPGTPFGFYSPKHNSLILNISTGGGTLVHEMIHPFVEANFENCPVWFNEGLASLFERPSKRNNHIVGLINWRLAGLQNAILTGNYLPVFELTQLSEDEFYDDSSGLPYAQAKYIAYFLQEHDLLVDYYHAFYENRLEDPTGLSTLLSITQSETTEEFETYFLNWILDLQLNN